jgi:hypothetical protein
MLPLAHHLPKDVLGWRQAGKSAIHKFIIGDDDPDIGELCSDRANAHEVFFNRHLVSHFQRV